MSPRSSRRAGAFGPTPAVRVERAAVALVAVALCAGGCWSAITTAPAVASGAGRDGAVVALAVVAAGALVLVVALVVGCVAVRAQRRRRLLRDWQARTAQLTADPSPRAGSSPTPAGPAAGSTPYPIDPRRAA